MFNKLIILLLLISLNYQFAYSEIGMSWYDENHISYEITSENPNEVRICNTISPLSSRIIIPETVVNPNTNAVYTVTEIGWGAFRRANCTYIKLPSTITDIGEEAFSECQNIEIIDLPGKLQTIGKNAFLSCNSLKSITIPQAVREIGHHAFYDCRSLESVVYNAQNCTNMSEDPLFPENIKTLKIGNNVVTIPDFAFTNCMYLTSLTLPSSITSIGEEAFSWCEGIKKVTIGENVNKIGRYAFHTRVDGLETVEFLATSCEECTHPFNGVKNLIIGDKVKNIPEYAFEFLGISSLSIPDAVESIGHMAFSSCPNLSEVTIGKNVKHCGGRIFDDCENLEKLHFNATNCDSFDSPQYLKELTIGENVKAIPSYAFSQCAELEFINIGNSLIRISTGAFSNCTKLTTVIVPNSVVEIGEAAFYNCVGLKSLKLGNSINSIENNAFYNCINLEKVDFASIHSLVNINFEDLLSNPLYFGQKLYINGAEVREVVIPSTISTIGNYTFAGCSGLTSVIIPTTVHYIGEAAFKNCSSLTTLSIPNSVTTIGIEAFERCANLTSISIPNSVTIIESGAFNDCSSLASIYIPASVTSIGNGAFYGCKNLKKVEFSSMEALCNTQFESYDANPLYYAKKMFINETEITDLNIPDSVTKIGDYTFCNGSNFKSVIIPSSINSIGIDAFYNCTQLVDIYSINPIPPMCHNTSFRNVPQWANVYVPVSAIPNYQTANAWSVFFNYHEHDFSGIENIMCENLFAETKVFTLNGICINSKATQKDIDNLPAGVYIINGKKVKIINAY